MKSSPYQPWIDSMTNYCGLRRTGGFLTGAGAPFVKSAPFSIVITNGSGV